MAQPTLNTASFSLRALHERVRADAWFKAVGMTVGMTIFFAIYFAVQKVTAGTAFIIPETLLDRLTGFQPWTIVPYLSLWFYISLPLAFMTERRQMASFAFGCFALSATGLAIFLLWPSTVAEPTNIAWGDHAGFTFLKSTDSTGNACPSLHAAFAAFTAVWLVRLLPTLHVGRWARLGNLVWAALIVFSTIGTKQHVAIDALCGTMLGTLVGLMCPRSQAAGRLP